MNKVANSYWINARLAAQNSSRTSAATLNMVDAHPFVNAKPSSTRVASHTRAATRSGRLISPLAVFSIVVITMFALCFTVTMRTHTELQTASAHYENVNAEVEALRNTNTELKHQVKRLHTDPRAIEDAAREQLGMVRPNDIIVPIR